MAADRSDAYQITRFPGEISTAATVDKIKQLIVSGSRSFPVRQKASEIVALEESRQTGSEIEAVYNWIRSHVPFRQDPYALELLETPERAIAEIESGRGYGLDCDGMVILAGALLQSLGHPIRLILTGAQPGRFSHIYLEAMSIAENRWIPVDLAMPHQGFGWSVPDPVSKAIVEMSERDLVPGAWAMSEVTPESLGRIASDYSSGSTVVTPDGCLWIREGTDRDPYWRKARRVAALGQVQKAQPDLQWAGPVDTSDQYQAMLKQYSALPPDAPHPFRNWSGESAAIFIMLTGRNVNPWIVRRRFGYAHPIEIRRKWRKMVREYRKAQEGKHRMPEESFKCPDPGFMDGNTGSQMIHHYSQWFPDDPVPDPVDKGGLPTGIEEFLPGKDLLPDPDEIGGQRDQYGQAYQDFVNAGGSAQGWMDFIGAVTGRTISPGLYGTAAAAEIRLSLESIRDAMSQLVLSSTLGQGWEEIVGLILMAAEIALSIWEMAESGEKDVRQIERTVQDSYIDLKTGLNDAGITDEDSWETSDWIMDEGMDATVDAYEDFEEAFSEGKSDGMDIACAKQILNALYKLIEMHGFASQESQKFRKLVRDLVAKGGMFACLAKERTLRDLRELKIQHLNGLESALTAYGDMLEQMLQSSAEIKAWALEYNNQPWDLDHCDIPGLPDTMPPDEIPEDRYPPTDEDADWWNYEHPNQDKVNSAFEDRLQEEKESDQPGESRGEAWGAEPGESTGAPSSSDRGGYVQAGKTSKTEQGWIARHPVATVGAVAATGVGGYLLIKNWGSIKAAVRRLF